MNPNFGTGKSILGLANDAAFLMRRRHSETIYDVLDEPESLIQPTELTFDGEPDCFYEGDGLVPYRGQEAAKRIFTLEIRALRREDRVKTLISGTAGTGKTTLARILALMIQFRHLELGLPMGAYYEMLPSQLASKERLDEFFRVITADPYAQVFIDEIHTLKNLEDFYHALHDSGAPRYPMANGSTLPVPGTISWLAATTDPGELDEAMRRRLNPEVRLHPPTTDDLRLLVLDQGEYEGIPVLPDAAFEIAERSLFPWVAREIHDRAKKIARVEVEDQIRVAHVRDALTMLEIDQHGLSREDRDVIAALFRAPTKRGRDQILTYTLSEETLTSSAGVDAKTYKKRVKPKLVRLGLLTTRGGQTLTDRAVEWYPDLRDGV